MRAPLILTLPPRDAGGVAPRRWAIDEATLASWLAIAPATGEQGATARVGIDRQELATYLEGIAETIARPPREPRFDYAPDTHRVITQAPGQSGLDLDVAAAVEHVLAAYDAGERAVTLPVSVVEPRTRAMLRRSRWR